MGASRLAVYKDLRPKITKLELIEKQQYNEKNGGGHMKNAYLSRQVFFAFNQLAIICYLGFMATQNDFIQQNSFVHFLLLSLLIFDAEYISYKNVKGNKTLNHFSLLLLLLGWQFLLYLFDFRPISDIVSTVLLPICFYQSIYFVQAFLFQESAYRGQKPLLAFLKTFCIIAVLCFFILNRVFFAAYQLQVLLSTMTLIIVGIMQRKRIIFVAKSQWKRILFSSVLVFLPFICYIIAFLKNAAYLENLGSYIPVMLTFVSIHSIVFQYRPKQVQFWALSGGNLVFLASVGLAGLIGIAYLFKIPLMAVFMSIHMVMLLMLIYNVLLYTRICSHPTDYSNAADRQHFYAYSLEQIKREEKLKIDFSNYLHDDILQDLLSIKNMIRKAEHPEVKQLLLDTLTELNSSIRFQMQGYHPTLIKSLTLKENIQSLLDSLSENNSATIRLDCDADIFLVEPYNMLIYRMIKELTTNALKHSAATTISVLLIQENGRITLKVTDNGKGFQPFIHQTGTHQGLASIEEQVSLLNGTMNIKPAAGGGTMIAISMPMNRGDSYESFISR